MQARIAVDGLEHALRMWEEGCFFLDAKAQIQQGLGVVQADTLVDQTAHWREFRGHLLRAFSHPLELQRFLESRNVVPRPPWNLDTFFVHLPEALAAWTRDSRRVFHISADLQMFLDATSLEGIVWSDVPWPFPSFALTLDEPLMEGEFRYSCVLISRECYGESNVTGCRIISDTYAHYTPVSNFEREAITKMLRRKEWQRTLDRLTRLLKRRLDQPLRSRVAYLEQDYSDILVTSSVTIMREAGDSMVPLGARDQFTERVLRLVVGFCLYLSILPAGSVHRSRWNPISTNTRPDVRAIIREAEVCMVSSIHTITPSQRQMLQDISAGKKGPYELSAHFRRGHWRRPPGQGNDPNAPRIIWVRPTLVRRDRLPQDALPGGAESVVT